MATKQNSTPSRFHNLSAEMLADEIGRIDAIQKAAEAELKALKDEFKRRGLTEVVGNAFTITNSEQIAGRLDTAAVKLHLGADYHRFEKPVVSNVIRIKAVSHAALALAA